MMNDEEYEILEVNDTYFPIPIEKECAELKPVIEDFVGSYVKNTDKPVEEWILGKLQESLPGRNPEEIRKMADEIVTTIKISEEKKKSLSIAVSNGRSKENWFASEVRLATSSMAPQGVSGYLAELDSAVTSANEELYKTITTLSGKINQNPRLDGFIAEQYHAQTFNMNAEATGSSYRAEVLAPKNGKYTKNSVDIVIKDGNGKIVKRYQCKYGKNAKETAKMFENGDYKGQQKLVPDGQQKEIGKKSTNVIEAPDGTKSNPLSKARAEGMRDEAQSGKWKDLNFNEYEVKDLAIGIGKQAGYAALQGAAISVGFDIAQKLINEEEIKGEEVVETALTSGADFGIKAAAAGAIKVGVEKDIIKVIPKGTPAAAIANIAFVAIEDIKIIDRMAKSEITFKEGINKLAETTVSTTAGLIASAKGAAIGASIGTVLGPAGIAVAGFVGGTVGYIGGSEIGKAVMKGVKTVAVESVNAMKEIGKAVGRTVGKVAVGVGNFFKAAGNAMSNLFA